MFLKEQRTLLLLLLLLLLWKLVADISSIVEAENCEVVFLQFWRKCNISKPCTVDEEKRDSGQWCGQYSTNCKNSEVIISHAGLGLITVFPSP